MPDSQYDIRWPSHIKQLSMRLFSSLFLVILLLGSEVTAQKIPVGSSTLVYPNQGEPLTLHTYRPSTYAGGPLLLVFHGVKRNAEDYRNFAINMAERFRAIVITPEFDSTRFPSARYQRGGLMKGKQAQPASAWTYATVPGIISFARQALGNDTLPYFLIGHSAGGQFLVRMAAFLPGEARRIVASNPGSDLFPTRDQPFGYGFGGLPESLSDDKVLKAYLAAPLTLYLGTDDIYPRPSFDDSPDGMRQGQHRLERGRNCYAFAKELAKQKGWPFNWRKVETPGIGHDAAYMFAAKEVEDALFGR
jgi:pimeloyl-ACP methyl ester carboxylesterase